jgi:hypothetical protein
LSFDKPDAEHEGDVIGTMAALQIMDDIVDVDATAGQPRSAAAVNDDERFHVSLLGE